MRPYVEATWPSDEEREEYYWPNRFQQNETEIIQVDGEDAGRITITRRPACIVLDRVLCPVLVRVLFHVFIDVAPLKRERLPQQEDRADAFPRLH